MHVLGKPFSWQLVTEAGFLGLAVDDGASRGELVAKADVVEPVARAHHHVGAVDGFLRLGDGGDLDAELRTQLASERLAVIAVGAEAANSGDLAHRADRHQLSTRLPTGAENGHRAGIL